VLHQQDGLVALRLDVVNQIEHHRHFVHAHARSRLVEHEDVRFERQQDRYFELALVAVREGGGQFVAAFGQCRDMEEILGLLDQFDMAGPH
jgi:hypothetical protein